MFFKSKISIVARRRGGQLATSAPVLTARGKPSTWFPRGRLVEQSRQDKTQKRRQKARTKKENPQQNTGLVVSFVVKHVV